MTRVRSVAFNPGHPERSRGGNRGIKWAIVVILALLGSGCGALHPGESRKVTAWGLWYAGAPGVIGLGYWHSERGDEVKSEQSAKPPKVN